MSEALTRDEMMKWILRELEESNEPLFISQRDGFIKLLGEMADEHLAEVIAKINEQKQKPLQWAFAYNPFRRMVPTK